MVRWPPGLHPQAARRASSKLAWFPGAAGTGARPITRVPVRAYTGRISGVPLTGGQQQGTVPGGGAVTLSVGPQAMGTVWYPTQVTLSTTTGPLDTSTALAYLGAQGVPVTLVGTVYTGNGTVALAVPPMTPGQVLIVSWTGAKPGDIAALNIIGTMDALTTG